MKRLLILIVLLSATSWAKDATISKGTYDGITATIESARYSSNGKLIVITAREPQTPHGFVLVCQIDEDTCSFPKVGSAYRVISKSSEGRESWGLVSPEKDKKGVIVVDLVYVGNY